MTGSNIVLYRFRCVFKFSSHCLFALYLRFFIMIEIAYFFARVCHA